MKRTLFPFTVAALAIATMVTPGHSQKPKDDVKAFMRGKLIHMQKVLEGLTVEDYDLIRDHANKLSLLSHATEWRVLPTMTYRQHSAEFRRVADSVVKAAKKKNLDGAAFGYVDLTMKCVSCHKYVREVRLGGSIGFRKGRS